MKPGVSPKVFSQDTEARLLRNYFCLSAILFSVSLFVSIFSPKSSFLNIALAGLLIVILGVVLLLILYHSFSKHPEVIKKRKIEKQVSDLNSTQKSTLSQLRIWESEKQTALLSNSSQMDLLVQEHEKIVQMNNDQKISVQKERQSHLDQQLSYYQEKWIQFSMKGHIIGNSDISGIGPKLSGRLASHGIVTANDVYDFQLVGIPGIGEAKSRELLIWQKQLRIHYEALKPKHLPPEMETAIWLEFKPKIEALDKEKYEILKNHELSIGQLLYQKNIIIHESRLKSAEKITENETISENIRNSITELALYQCYVFNRYLQELLNRQFYSPGLRVPFLFANSVLGILCICIFSGMLAASAGVTIYTNWPTSTNTPSITYTATLTKTSTSTLTATITLTQTMTLTPTITPTNSETSTSTRTYTITPTSTRTRTKTSTPSKTRTRLPTYTPYTPSYRCGADCWDGWISYSTGRGTCSHHGGVKNWRYC